MLVAAGSWTIPMRFSTFFALLIAVAPGGWAQEAPRPSTGEAWQIIQPIQSSLVYARDGTIIGEIGRPSVQHPGIIEFRTSVKLTTLPTYVAQAFIAVEDERFYTHNGVDYSGIPGILKTAITEQRLRGGSTITQQLAGIMHPDLIDRQDKSPMRTLRQQSAAKEMETHYTKQAILEAYLNWVDLGHNWFGVDAAARHYFGTTAAQLTLAQAASIAALPKQPPKYDPIEHPDTNKRRRNTILDLMVQQNLITRAAGESAKLEPVKTAPNNGMSAASNYFIDLVKKQAAQAKIPVGDGAYRIYTTLDPALQTAAVTALVNGANALEKREGYKHITMANRGTSTDYLQGAVVAMDPYTGDVRALVGGRNYALAPFPRATEAKRQPGSGMKPIVYSAALQAGIPDNTIIPDTAITVMLPSGDLYRPGNSDGKFLGPLTMREALVKSRNPVAVQLGLAVGMDTVAALALRMGITTPIDPVPASAIGATAIHPIDLVAAYTAFANNGQVVSPRMITRIDNANGQTVFAQPPSAPQQVLDPRVAFIMRDMMREAAERGTGAPAREAVPSSVPIAGKTGTTNDNVDVWFTGMTPDLVATVWLGFDKPKTIQAGSASAVGGTFAAPIWGAMMAKYYANHRVGDWPAAPGGLVFAEIDHDSGLLANPFTPADKRVIEYFLPGTEPGALKGNPWNLPRWGAVIVP